MSQEEHGDMAAARFSELLKTGGRLSDDELNAGWHYCKEWDGDLFRIPPTRRACEYCGFRPGISDAE